MEQDRAILWTVENVHNRAKSWTIWDANINFILCKFNTYRMLNFYIIRESQLIFRLLNSVRNINSLLQNVASLQNYDLAKRKVLSRLNFLFFIYRLSFVFMPCLLCHRAARNCIFSFIFYNTEEISHLPSNMGKLMYLSRVKFRVWPNSLRTTR